MTSVQGSVDRAQWEEERHALIASFARERQALVERYEEQRQELESKVKTIEVCFLHSPCLLGNFGLSIVVTARCWDQGLDPRLYQDDSLFQTPNVPSCTTQNLVFFSKSR